MSLMMITSLSLGHHSLCVSVSIYIFELAHYCCVSAVGTSACVLLVYLIPHFTLFFLSHRHTLSHTHTYTFTKSISFFFCTYYSINAIVPSYCKIDQGKQSDSINKKIQRIFRYLIERNHQMNTVTVYDEYIDKYSIFGAYKELHKLGITQIVLGSLGMIGSLIYWIIPKLQWQVCFGRVCLEVIKQHN